MQIDSTWFHSDSIVAKMKSPCCTGLCDIALYYQTMENEKKSLGVLDQALQGTP